MANRVIYVTSAMLALVKRVICVTSATRALASHVSHVSSAMLALANHVIYVAFPLFLMPACGNRMLYITFQHFPGSGP